MWYAVEQDWCHRDSQNCSHGQERHSQGHGNITVSPDPLPAIDHQQLFQDREMQRRVIPCKTCGNQHSLMEFAMRPTGWMRPNLLRDDVTYQTSTVPWVVFRGEPEMADIRQGIVGNCWLVCAMSALAERPENIRRILLTAEYNPAGAYQVRLCRNGE